MYRLRKMKGGTFKDYKDQYYIPLTDQQILKHFNGNQLIGIYPLLPDNTSWFIAADFDKEKWADECRTSHKHVHMIGHDNPTENFKSLVSNTMVQRIYQ